MNRTQATLLMSFALCGVLAPRAALAYSNFGDYTRSIQEGGGGGRLFTGTPADGYGCDVCHRGSEGANLEVMGLPDDGYVPGQSYEITLLWPATTPHVALMAELTDATGRPSGVTALPPYASWQLGERCEGSGLPAADVCRVGGAGSGCCRDLEGNRDACSFPGERAVLWVPDCASRFARVVWTAPSATTGDVWFSTQMVTSNLQNDAVGDGVSSVRMRIRPQGMSPELSSAVGGCRTAAGRPGGLYPPGLVALTLVIFTLRRRRHGPSPKRKSLAADMGHSDEGDHDEASPASPAIQHRGHTCSLHGS